MARETKPFQVSLLVDASGANPFRRATLNSALSALRAASRAGFAVELLVRMDQNDQLRHDVLEAFPSAVMLPDDRAVWVRQAKGDYITLLKAPDLIGESWIVQAMKALNTLDDRSAARTIVHPETILFPDFEYRAFVKIADSAVLPPSAKSAFTANPYGTLIFAHRLLLEEFPPEEASFQGDCPAWKWNCDTLAGGFRHLPAPGSFHVVRTREGALDSGCFGASKNCIPGPSRWFERVDEERAEAAPSGTFSFSPLAAELRETAPDLVESLSSPGWIAAAASCQALEATKVFFEARRAFSRAPEYLVVHHFLSVGGSERETLLNLEAIAAVRPSLRLGVILTEDQYSHWKDRVPPGTPVLEFGAASRMLSGAEKEIALFRLLLQLAPRIINNVISPLCWRVFADRASILARKSRLFVTEFCVNLNLHDEPESYAYSHLPECWEHVDLLISDNSKLLNCLSKEFGYDRSVALQFYPEVAAKRPRKPLAHGSRPRIVWAGRFCRQKRPDILFEVARRCPDFGFHVYHSVPDTAADAGFFEELRCLPNVNLHGPFEDFEPIADGNYDILLYTSGWDGMPNIILEAIASGLVVVAPAVGGIPEIISPETGYLVSGPDRVDEFVACLHSAALDPVDAFERARTAQRALFLSRNKELLQASWTRLLNGVLGEEEVPEHVLTVAP